MNRRAPVAGEDASRSDVVPSVEETIVDASRSAEISRAKNCAARVMRGPISSKERTAVPRYDASVHAEPVAPNVLARRFAIESHAEPDRAWASC